MKPNSFLGDGENSQNARIINNASIETSVIQTLLKLLTKIVNKCNKCSYRNVTSNVISRNTKRLYLFHKLV